MVSKTTKLAERLGELLKLLNKGNRVDIYQLSEYFSVSARTVQRDIRDRFTFLEWEEYGPRYYKLNLTHLGILNEQDIQRFARFASIADLFPKIDREFYQEQLTRSVQVKGIQYEDISHLDKAFKQLQEAIQQHHYVHFKYIKNQTNTAKFYQIAPYSLINKNGIWYLIGTDNDKQKTFCFTQISMLRTLNETFEPNKQFIEEISKNDSISHGNQISEVIIQVAPFATPYFLRRNLLPNQKLLHKLDDGGLLLACENVNELDIVPLVQYWIPHLTIISPQGLQGKMVEEIQEYIAKQY
ncbi:helix-turn-helix transcriptional regulator [Moraxella sp. ZJ142]|uniref:helix-turn-helix transcriptional regulator n=1 Tax=Moraxella marmotae TaxID=3344520 RepID=UPI0035D4F0E3